MNCGWKKRKKDRSGMFARCGEMRPRSMIGDAFDLADEVVLNSVGDDRIVLIQRVIGDESSNPHGIGEKMTWKKIQKRRERER